MHRRTLSSETGPLRGLGLFSGLECSVNIRPSPAATGVLVSSPGRGPVAVHVSRCIDWKPRGWPAGVPVRNTALGTGDWSVGTTEHVLSAVAGLGITDCVIEWEGPEFPILDGSSQPFVGVLQDKVVELEKKIEPILLRHAVQITDGSGGEVTVKPRDEGPLYSYTLDYGEGSPLTPQTAFWNGDAAEYARDIAPARTFSLRAEAEAARSAGLFRNFSPRDLLVIGDDGQPIENAWRLSNEPARHKLLDLIGDLALLGRPLHAEVNAKKSGHALVRELCRQVLKQVARL
jgi:UDP-3-O-acyl-N-acetylglucosamine deacetylase